MSCRIQWHSPFVHPSWALQMQYCCGLCTPTCYSWALIAVGMSMRGIYPQAKWLQGLAATTMGDQLWRGPPNGAALISAGLWCLLSPPLECVACGGGWVVLRCGLKLSTRCAGSGAPRRCRARSATACVLPRPLRMSYRVIPRWLLLVLGLETPRKGQAENHAATSAGPRAT